MKPYFKETIKHWERMIEWVETQNPELLPNGFIMQKAIDENWGREDCPLCKEYKNLNDSCNRCALCKAVGKCRSKNLNNLWGSVWFSKTWGEWLINAKLFVKQIKEAGK